MVENDSRDLLSAGHDQRCVIRGRIFQDGVEAGHLARRRQHLMLVGVGDR